MKFNKTTMSLALTAAMFGSVAVTQQAFAVPDVGSIRDAIYDIAAVDGKSTDVATAISVLNVDEIKALVATSLTQGTYVSANGMGQALIYPYYTVRGGFKTTINVFNSSDDRAVAVKVRFREFQNSRDVLDFNLILSPNDKWYGVVQEDADKGAVLVTNDESCTAPKIVGSTAPFDSSSYSSGYQDAGDQGLERLKSGYVEIIPMAWSTVGAMDKVGSYSDRDGSPLNSAAAALHKQPSGIPHDCSMVVEHFAVTDDAEPSSETGTDGQPKIKVETVDGVVGHASAWEAIPKGENPLFGEYGIFNSAGGIAGGSNAVALADWMAGTPLFTAQEPPFFLEPTLATAAGVWNTALLYQTDAALTSSQVLNEWANNETNGAHTDWVVTFPTKSFHVDQSEYAAFMMSGGNILTDNKDFDGDGSKNEKNIQAGSSLYRYDRWNLQFTNRAPFLNRFEDGKSEIQLGVAKNLYNNEEGKPGSGGVTFSPGNSAGTPKFYYEANLITFGGGEVLNSGTMKNGNPVALTIDPVRDITEGRKHGMLKLQVSGTTSKSYTIAQGHAEQVTVTTTSIGLPMVGFAVKERNQGDASKSYGQLFDHKWITEATTTVTTP